MTETLTEFMSKGWSYRNNNTKHYSKVVAFGDSVTRGAENDGYSYVDMLKDWGYADSVTNYAVDGTAFTVNNENGYPPALYKQIWDQEGNWEDADLIIIGCGGNDAFALRDGYISNVSSISSAMKWIDKLIRTGNDGNGGNKTCDILWVVSLPSANTYASAFPSNCKDVYDEEVKYGKRMGWIVADEFSETGYNDYTRSTMCHDNVHFNNFGYSKVMRNVCKALGLPYCPKESIDI